MIYYFIAFLIILLPLIVKDRKKYSIVITAILVLFAGLRNTCIGPDTAQYDYIFNEMAKVDFGKILSYRNYNEQTAELGYIYFGKIVSLFANYEVFKFLCSAISLIPAGWLIYKYSRHPSISYFVFFTLPVFNQMGMSMMRQGIAFCFFIIAYEYCTKRNLKRFLITIGIGSLFHISILVMIPVYFIYALPYRRKNNFMLFVAMAVVYAFSSVIFTFMNSFARIEYGTEELVGFKMLYFLLGLFALSYFVKEEHFRKVENSGQLYLLVYTILLWLIGMNLAAVLRLASYTEFFLCLYIPNVLTLITGKRIGKLCMIGSCAVCFMIMLTITLKERDFQSYYPYYFNWEKNEKSLY